MMKSKSSGRSSVSPRLQEYLAKPGALPRHAIKCGWCVLRDKKPDIYQDVLTLFVSGWRGGMVQRYLESIGITALSRNQFDKHFIVEKHHQIDTLPSPLPSSLTAQLEALPDNGE